MVVNIGISFLSEIHAIEINNLDNCHQLFMGGAVLIFSSFNNLLHNFYQNKHFISIKGTNQLLYI